MLEPKIIDSYIEVLESELLLATGCTEPIALAYCAATLRKVLKQMPEKVTIARQSVTVAPVPDMPPT